MFFPDPADKSSQPHKVVPRDKRISLRRQQAGLPSLSGKSVGLRPGKRVKSFGVVKSLTVTIMTYTGMYSISSQFACKRNDYGSYTRLPLYF